MLTHGRCPSRKKETAQSTNNLPEQKPRLEDLPWKEDFDSASEKAAPAKENAAQHTPSNEDLPPDSFNADEAPLPPEPPVHRAEPTPPAQSHAPAQNGDQVLFDGWAEFMDEIYKKDIAIYGVLNGSRGYVRGEYFLIDGKNPTLRQFIKIPTHSKAIKQALYDVTGINYKLGLIKSNAEAKVKRDPLEDLISKASGNVNIEVD